MTAAARNAYAPLASAWACGAALLLSACASVTTPQPPATTAPIAPPPATTTPPPPPVRTPPPTALSFSSLAGWADEDHLAALNAFRAGCGVAKEPAMVRVCGLARDTMIRDEASARAFLEANFRPEPVGDEGLLTA